MARIKSDTFTHHTIRVEMKDFRRLMEIPDTLRPFSVWIRYDGGDHVAIDCSGTLPPVEPFNPADPLGQLPKELPKRHKWRPW